MTVLRQIDPPPPATEDVSRHCGNCGYDLRAVTAARCPECGIGFDPHTPPVANVPWFHRQSIGTLAALWQTMWLVTFRPDRLVREVRAPGTLLDVPAARRFRHLCVVVASASVAGAVALHMHSPAYAAAMFVITLPPMLLFFSLTAPLIATADFDTAVRAPSFEAMNEFSNAPLLLMPLVPLAAAVSRAAGREFSAPAVLLLLAIGSIWMVYKFAYQAHAHGRGLTWLAVHLLFAAVVWAVFALMCLLLILGLVAFTSRLFDW